MLDFFYLVVDVASILLGLKKVLSLVLGYLSYMLQLYSEVSQDLHFKLNFMLKVTFQILSTYAAVHLE